MAKENKHIIKEKALQAILNADVALKTWEYISSSFDEIGAYIYDIISLIKDKKEQNSNNNTEK